MDGAGIAIGAVASAGFAAGMNVPAATGASAPAPPAAGMVATASAGVVVTISDAALHALALDGTGGLPSRLGDDLAALALLAILEHDRRQHDPLVDAAAAIAAYMAIQALSGG